MKSIIIDVKKIVTLAEIGLGAERPLNKEKRYWIKKLSKEKKQKPILVSPIKDSGYYILCDGWHRIQAVKKQKKKTRSISRLYSIKMVMIQIRVPPRKRQLKRSTKP